MTKVIGFILLVIGVCVLVWIAMGYSPRPIVNQPSNYQITLECEKLSATATNANWSYENCLKNLNGSLTDVRKIAV